MEHTTTTATCEHYEAGTFCDADATHKARWINPLTRRTVYTLECLEHATETAGRINAAGQTTARVIDRNDD